jgi:hypothetical protein
MHARSQIGLLWAPRQGRVAGAVGVPVPEHRPGDCLVWGAWERGVGGRGTGAAPILSYAAAPAAEGGGHGGGSGNDRGGGGGAGWAPTSVPRVVADTAHLDAVEVRQPPVCGPVRRWAATGAGAAVSPARLGGRLCFVPRSRVCGAGVLARAGAPRGCLPLTSFP